MSGTMNPLWTDIIAQENNIREMLDYFRREGRERLLESASFIDPGKPIVLIGIASAAYICWPAQVYLTQAGYLTRVMNAADALYHEWPSLKKANVVINSRSGETAEIVKLADRLQRESIRFLAITNEPASTLAQRASTTLWANTRKDALVSINIITGMMLATLMWAAAVRDELDQVQSDLTAIPERVGETVYCAIQMADRLADVMSGCSPIYLLGRGASQGAALCGRLVLEEVARQPSVALEAAEFRQGPNEVVDEHFCSFIFVGRGETAALTRSLTKELQDHGGKVIAVGEDAVVGDLPTLAFPLPSVPEAFTPILEIIPVQVLAYKLAERQGIDPGTVRYITKIITEESAQ